MVAGEVGGHPEEPGARLVVVTDLLETLPGAQERLLGDIVAGLLIARDPPEVAEDGRFVSVEELLEGGFARLQILRRAGGLRAVVSGFIEGRGG